MCGTATSRFEYHNFLSNEGHALLMTCLGFQYANMALLDILAYSSLVPEVLFGLEMGSRTLRFDRYWYVLAEAWPRGK